MRNETSRQLVHIALFLLAFLFKYLTKIEIVLLLGVLVVAALVIVPRSRIRHRLYRPSDATYSPGAVSYFATLLVIAIFQPAWVVGLAWATLAFGDGAATLVGTMFSSNRLPWNQNKTWIGSIAFFVAATVAGLAIAPWLNEGVILSAAAPLVVTVAAISALVESLPLRLNDNISVPITAAIAAALLA